jgi:hypothetical protein
MRRIVSATYGSARPGKAAAMTVKDSDEACQATGNCIIRIVADLK